jgi:integrase
MLDEGTSNRLVEELAKQQRSRRTPRRMTIARLCKLYQEYADVYYQSTDGQRGSEATTIEHALRLLRKNFGRSLVIDFGPLKLKAVREEMVTKDWCRKTVNDQIGRIKRMFKWAVENELIPPDLYHGLQAVGGLRAGRSSARESKPVKPAPERLIEASLKHVYSPVAAMVRIQLLTGMRPGEVIIMRTADIDTSEQPWRYTPLHHKTEHHGHQRVVFLGPKSQEVIQPFLKLENSSAFLFSPVDAVEERKERYHALRKTPMSCGNVPGSNVKRRPRRVPGAKYDTGSYARAIKRACEVAFPVPEGLTPEQVKLWRKQHHWHPHQLRHNAATKLRKEFGIEIAQVVLGHKTLAVTQVYAERDVEKAQKTMLEIG